MFKDHTLQTTGRRSIYGLIAGAAVGAAFAGGHIGYSLSVTLDVQYPSFKAAFIDISGAATVIFALAFAYWGVGIVVIGCPVWFVLHRLGLRTWMAALTSGFLVSVIAGLWMAPDFFSRAQYDSSATFGNAAIFGLIGTAAALTIWRIAYRRPAEHV